MFLIKALINKLRIWSLNVEIKRMRLTLERDDILQAFKHNRPELFKTFKPESEKSSGYWKSSTLPK